MLNIELGTVFIKEKEQKKKKPKERARILHETEKRSFPTFSPHKHETFFYGDIFSPL